MSAPLAKFTIKKTPIPLFLGEEGRVMGKCILQITGALMHPDHEPLADEHTIPVGRITAKEREQ